MLVIGFLTPECAGELFIQTLNFLKIYFLQLIEFLRENLRVQANLECQAIFSDLFTMVIKTISLDWQLFS